VECILRKSTWSEFRNVECIRGKSGVYLEMWSVLGERVHGVNLEMWSVYGESGVYLEMWSVFWERVEGI